MSLQVNNANVNAVNVQAKKEVKTEKPQQEEREQLTESCSSKASKTARSYAIALYKTEYNPNGTLKSKTTLLSHKEYDSMGHLVYKEFPNGSIKKYDTSDGKKKLVYEKLSDGTEIKHEGKELTKEYTDGSIKKYDTSGIKKKLIYEKYPDGIEKTYNPCVHGSLSRRLSSVKFPDGACRLYDRGHLDREYFSDGTIEYNYILSPDFRYVRQLPDGTEEHYTSEERNILTKKVLPDGTIEYYNLPDVKKN